MMLVFEFSLSQVSTFNFLSISSNYDTFNAKLIQFVSFFVFEDDGTTPDRIAQITGPPDRCQHAAEIITDLLRSVQVRSNANILF